jgi:hypothetical protein
MLNPRGVSHEGDHIRRHRNGRTRRFAGMSFRLRIIEILVLGRTSTDVRDGKLPERLLSDVARAADDELCRQGPIM